MSSASSYSHCCSIIDYQHDPSDVVGAALLGTMVRGLPPAGAQLFPAGRVTGAEAAPAARARLPLSALRPARPQVALVYLLRAIPRWRRVVCSNCAAVGAPSFCWGPGWMRPGRGPAAAAAAAGGAGGVVRCSACLSSFCPAVSHYGTMASSTGDVEAPIVRRDGSAKQRSGGGAADVGGGTAGVTL